MDWPSTINTSRGAVSLNQCAPIWWSDIALLAIFEIGHIVETSTSVSADTRIACAAKFSFSDNRRDPKYYKNFDFLRPLNWAKLIFYLVKEKQFFVVSSNFYL